jgi:mycoredoxin
VPYAGEVRRRIRTLFVVLPVLAFGIGAEGAREAVASPPSVSSLASAPVTVYGAKWCGACRALQQGLTDRKIGYDVVDVDENPAAFARARAAAGSSNAIPLTGVAKNSSTVWIVGANVDEVERALKD